jgi:L-seryl-tRNA(Ser) seleniumtransferase
LMRALRVDKLTLAALEATLHLARDPELGGRRIPLWAFLNAPLAGLVERAEQLAVAFRDELGLNASVVQTTAFLGGGSVPVEPIPTAAVCLGPPYPGTIGSESHFARALRQGEPAVVGRVQGGTLLLDLRALPESDDEVLLEAVRRVATGSGAGSPGSGALPPGDR